MTGESRADLDAMQDRAFESIEQNAKRYSEEARAVAVYIQGTLFDYTSRQRFETEQVFDRAELAASEPECIFLIPNEYWELRYRAAYAGAGLATEPHDNVPDLVHSRLSNNLENYPSKFEYEQLILRGLYKFKPSDLRGIIRHDFSIAAADFADGDLARLCEEKEDPDSDNEGIVEEFWSAVDNYDGFDDSDDYDHDDNYDDEDDDYVN